MNELQRAVKDLHGSVSIQLDIRYLPTRQIEWEAVVSGEDFLNGPWKSSLGRRVSRNLRMLFKRDLPRALAGEEKNDE